MRIPTLAACFLVCVGLAADLVDARELTFEERIEAQAAIERVYHRHRSGGARPLDEAVPREVLERKVTDYLVRSAALHKVWREPVSTEALDQELERIAGSTHFPERLAEVYVALGNDGFLIRECFARASLVRRRTAQRFDNDRTIHRSAKDEIRDLHRGLTEGDRTAYAEHSARHSLELKRLAPGDDTRNRFERQVESAVVESGEFDQLRSLAPERVGEVGPIIEDRESFHFAIALHETADEASLAIYRVRKTSWEAWSSSVASGLNWREVEAVASSEPPPLPATSGASATGCLTSETWADTAVGMPTPSARWRHTAVWTGAEVVVWGGLGPSRLDTGARYDPVLDTWQPITTEDAPQERSDHSAVWTGTEMIVWGGSSGSGGLTFTGGRYDPVLDSWSPTSTTGTGGKRTQHTAVWTGSEMLVWGGLGNGNAVLGDGVRYDPAFDSWSAISAAGAPQARYEHTAVWIGSELIVWGGEDDGGNVLSSGGRYDPTQDSWSATGTVGAPIARQDHAAVWTGSEMVVWGGLDSGGSVLSSGGRYDPVGDTWAPTSGSATPTARRGHTAVWTGSELIVWGGTDDLAAALASGGRYDPFLDTWATASVVGAPTRIDHVTVWTGDRMFVWGGKDDTGVLLQSGGRYDPSSDAWSPTATPDAPLGRSGHRAVWTGSEMVVWGGTSGADLDTGGRYDPLTATWADTSVIAAPPPRARHTAIWTGSEMIVWGGGPNGGEFSSGGRYDPVSDTWTPTAASNAPSPRALHTAVWTGTEMIVWGGAGYTPGLTYFNTGGRYDPATDTWIPGGTTTSGAPEERIYHTAVWTGTEMMVWGGTAWSGRTDTGARYSPATDSWSPTSTQSAPAARASHTAVWTGTEMIVWGGMNVPVDFAFNSGGRYDPIADTWSPTSEVGTPTSRRDHTAVWSGAEMVVWGGNDGFDKTASVGRYDPEADRWETSGTLPEAPTARDSHAAIWTSAGMLAWGGSGDGAYLGSGGAFVVVEPASELCAISPEIDALAAELGFDPLAIYLHVRNNFEFEPYHGYLKGPQATLETGRGNDYDLAVLTAALLQVSGFDTRYARGVAKVSAEAAVEWLGLHDPAAADMLFNAAGIAATPVMSGPDIDHFLIDRLWVEVEAPMWPTNELVWFPLDPAYKLHDLDAGIPGLLTLEPFDESTYLSVTRPELTYEFYGEQLRDYLEVVFPGTALDDVPLSRDVRPQTLGRLPRTLPYHLASFDTTYTTIPDDAVHRVTVRLEHDDAGPAAPARQTHFNRQFDLPAISLARMTLSYVVDPDTDWILDTYGDLANVPPGTGRVIPQLKLDGEIVAQGDPITYLDPEPAELFVEYSRPGDPPGGIPGPHFTLAGEWVAVGIQAAQLSDAHLQRQVRTIVEATELEAAGGTPDPDELIGALLYLAIMEYHANAQLADDTLASLAHFERIPWVSEGIARANQEVYTVDGIPFASFPGAVVLDVRFFDDGLVALDDDQTPVSALRRLTGFNGSAEEHALWEAWLNLPAMSTIKSLQLANEGGIPVFVIDETDANPNNDWADLGPQLNLHPFIEAQIEAFATNDFVVTVPRDETPLNDWVGVGYIVEDPTTGGASYFIFGGLTAPPEAPPSGTAGGAATVVLEDGTTLVVPAGQLGDAPGQSFAGDPVNVANGNFYREELDFEMPALGEPLAFARFYNSQSTFDGALGLGWTHLYSDVLMSQPDGSVIWIDGSGSAYTFDPGGPPGEYVTPPGLRETLSEDASGFTLRRFDGRTQQFDLNGVLLSRSDRNGNTFTFGYDGMGRLTSVTDPASRALTLTYTPTDRIETVSDFTGRTWTYAYNGDDRLRQVTSPSDVQTLAVVTQYTYDEAGRLKTITEPNGGVRELRYYSNGRVAEVIDSTGGVMTLVYNPFKMKTEVTNERGKRSVYGFNADGNLISLAHPGGALDRWTYVDNRITSHTDPLGSVETFEYDAEGNLERSVDLAGIETQYEYEPPYENLTKVTRPGGRESVVQYDANGNLFQHTDGAGHVWIANHNAQGLPETVTDGRGATVTYQFNGAGQWTSLTTQLPSTESRVYDPRGTLDRITDANGNPLTFEYDLLDRLTSTTDAENNTTVFGYDAAGRLTSVTDPRSHTTTFEYDLKNRLTRRIAPDDSVTRFEYDELGNLVAEIDAMGRRSRVAYDDRDRPVELTGADGSVIDVSYDATGRIRSITDPLENTTTFEYDPAGRLTARIDATGERAEWTYDVNGNPETFLDRRGALTTYEYDALNRITEVRAPEDQIRTADYDENGNLVEVASYDVLGLGSIPDDPRTLPDSRKRVQTNLYDVLDRLEEVINPEGDSTLLEYDAVGNVTKLTDERGKITRAEYDLADRLTKIIRPDLGEVVIGYDAARNRTSMRTPRGGTYAWGYDNRNRVVAMTDPNGRTTSFQYDLVGNPVRRTHPDGTWVKQNYDPMNRPVLLRRSDGSFTSSTYDAVGNLTRTTTEKTALVLTYDTLHRLVTEKLTFTEDGVSKTTGYAYDDEGGLDLVTDPEGRTVDYIRDLAARITSITDSAGTSVSLSPNGYGERAGICHGNSTCGTQQYDKNGRLTDVVWGPSILDLSYTRDPAGNPVTVVESVAGAAETLTLAYDDLSRPLSVTALNSPGTRSETFGYDMNDNLTDPGDGSLSVFDPADQLAAGPGGAYLYDTRGNRFASDDGTVRLETPHDPSNRITAIRRFTGGALDHAVTLVRDGLGRVVEAQANGASTRYVHAFANRLVEYDDAGSVDVTYTMGDDLDDVFAGIYNGSVKYMHRDAVNSVRTVTGAGGSADGWRHFGQFGRAILRAGFQGGPGFTGRFVDEATGLIDVRARFMDPHAGGFLSRDPIGISQRVPSPFAYAANRPLVFNDPLGLFPVAPEAGLHAHVGGHSPLVFRAGFDPMGVVPGGGRSRIRDLAIVGGSVAAGFVPIVGEALDLAVLLDPNSSGLDRTLAGVSLAANVLTAGLLPNFGATARAVRSVGEITQFADEIGSTVTGPATVRRFIRQAEFDAIQQALRNGDDVTIGRFFTPDAITDSRVATMQLSLPGTGANPVAGFVDVPRSELPSGYLQSFGPRLTNPDFGLPGGGLEVVLSESPTVRSAVLTLVSTP